MPLWARILVALVPPLAERVLAWLARREERRAEAEAMERERLRLLALAEEQRRAAHTARLTQEDADAMAQRLRDLARRRRDGGGSVPGSR